MTNNVIDYIAAETPIDAYTLATVHQLAFMLAQLETREGLREALLL